jgi:hypothetical protein
MYDESGKALRELKRVGDLGNFHYVDNLSRSLRHTGRILIDLIPKIYDTERSLTILREDGSEEQVKINPQQGTAYQKKQGEDGKSVSMFNPKVGEYEVAVTIGPSFATKRAEAADSMVNFLKVLPNTAPMVADLIAKNMDWPGAEEIAERLASQLPPNLLQKDTSDFPPQAKALIQSLNAQLQKLGQEHQQALAMLGDKDKDRAVKQDQINKDFEAKLTKVVADYMAKVNTDMQNAMETINKTVQDMQQEFMKQNIMAEAGSKIKEANDKAEKAKAETQPARQGDIGQLAKMAESMAEAHQQGTEVLKSVKDMLASGSKPKKGKIKGPSGKTYEIAME